MLKSYKKNIRVLVIEPAIQRPSFDRARPNGNLGPAYLIGALKQHGIEADYLDATVGEDGRDLKETFYNRKELENGLIRFGMSIDELPEIFSNYDIEVGHEKRYKLKDIDLLAKAVEMEVVFNKYIFNILYLFTLIWLYLFKKRQAGKFNSFFN